MSPMPPKGNAQDQALLQVYRLGPLEFLHVLDNNSNTTRVLVGPQAYTKLQHESVILGPQPMIIVPPRHYCVISSPAIRDADGLVTFDASGCVKLQHGEVQVFFNQDPFPLYPGETLLREVGPMRVVNVNCGIRLRAIRDCIVDDLPRCAGDEWRFKGPGTYIPQVEVEEIEDLHCTVINKNEAVHLRARKNFTDSDGRDRIAGEEWLYRVVGAYLPEVEEEVLRKVEGRVLTEKEALHLRARTTFIDIFGKERKAGEEWVVTVKDAETYIPDVHEEIVGVPRFVTLTNRQYCIIIDPVVEGKQLFGTRELRQGEMSFYVKPGEVLENEIEDVLVLGEDEAVLLKCRESFFDESMELQRNCGEVWMVYGPREYVPTVEVEIVERRSSIPLDANEGIYVRNLRSGEVRAHIGSTYMLEPFEELWHKELPLEVESLLRRDDVADRNERSTFGDQGEKLQRDPTRVVTFRVPHNAAVQIYDYRERKARVCFGPDLVRLDPEEQFTLLSLSGGKPKSPNQIRSLSLLLGPDFMTDVIVVETSDHARLQLQLSYNWHFDVDKKSSDSVAVFNVPDFVGDACKAIASRVRGAVAGATFDYFHKHSAKLIRVSVFGQDDNGKVNPFFRFDDNGLVVTNVDVQNVEPVDQRTREALQRSVQMAIEITTASQEANAKHEAEKQEQMATGLRERQKILDETEAEKARKKLLELKNSSAAVELMGKAQAEVNARMEAVLIECSFDVKEAKLVAESLKIKEEAELECLTLRNETMLAHQKAVQDLELWGLSEKSRIETEKFENIVNSLGADTIKAISQAGPELQVKLLEGLGLQGYMITDGTTPINLFNTAKGLIGDAPST